MTNYRNIESATIELHPRLTIFLGPNGVGKTNILESIHLLSFPRSFRTKKDELLRMWEADYCRVEGKVSVEDEAHSLVYFYDKSKKLQKDGVAVKATDFVGFFLSVLFAPEDVDLLASSPGRRRGFLDSHLSLLSPTYFLHLLHYNKVVKQRNRLLSKPSVDLAELEYWNQQQIEHGSALIIDRLSAIDELNTLLFPHLQITYQSSLADQPELINQTFQEKQAAMLEREKIIGHSMLGPHRDDWILEELSPEVRDLGVYGSRGEQRMGVINLKQAQLDIIFTQKEQRAVLLLDDVLSELDAKHQEELLLTLGNQQTVLTTASLSDVPSELLSDALVYEVSPGKILKSEL